MKAIETAKSAVKSFFDHWNTPSEGRYMPNKEILSLSFGGIGVKFIVYCINMMILTTGNTLIGNTIGITPSALYIIYIISLIVSFPLTAVRAKIIDNTRNMKGKYRPYIISMGIPTVILGIGFIIMPYESMDLLTKCVVVLLFNIGFQFFFNFMNDSYESLINVLSPNSIERSDVLSVKNVVDNLAPSIANILLPLVAKAITGENTLYDLKIYRVLFPPMLLIGFAISVLVYVNTEEKIVQAKTHVIQVKFFDAFRAVAKNKYFWVISLAGWLGFLEGAFGSILGWMYNYQGACTPFQYTIITAISGNASFWPNLIAPYFIRKYGKKKILVFTNILNIFLIAALLPVVRITQTKAIIWIFLFCSFFNTFISALGHLLTPSINADIRDYQQYISGERIDGMFAAVGLIGNVITMLTSSVIPAIYERTGLNTATAISLGYDGSNVYDVLYDPTYFVNICSVLIIASVVGAVMNVIPMFFYDFTETRQKATVRVLKIRAMFEDYGNNVMSDSQMTETVEIIREAREFAGRERHIITKDGISEARKTKDKELIKAAKKKYNDLKDENEKQEIADFIMAEINRFDTPLGKIEIEFAEKIAAAGLNGFMNLQLPTLDEAKKMPKSTEEEKAIRKNAIETAKNMALAKKSAQKYFPDGIKEFDASVFEPLFEAEDKNEAAIHDALQQMKKLKEKKMSTDGINAEITKLQKEKNEIKKKIKNATEQNSIYYRAAKPYLDAKKLLLQKENYGRIDEIESKYLKLNVAESNS